MPLSQIKGKKLELTVVKIMDVPKLPRINSEHLFVQAKEQPALQAQMKELNIP